MSYKIVKVKEDHIRTYDDKLEGDVKTMRQAASTVSWCLDELDEPKLYRNLQNLAVKVHKVMRCKDFCQIDCR